MQGKKVLLIDADPQGDLTTCLGWQDTDNLGITLATKLTDVLNETMNDPTVGILHHDEGVDLVPANLELSAMEFNLVNAMSRETALRNYLSEVKDKYDYILIDCMPSLGMVTINALSAADSVIIPVQAQYLPAKGMLGFVKEAFLMEKERQELLDLHCEATVDGYTDFIFINRFGQPQHQATLNKAIRRIIRDCNDEQLLKDENAEVLLPHFSCHSLRHTFTTRMCEAGVNVKVIQDTLGHKDISTTLNIYTDVTKELRRSEFEGLDSYFKNEYNKANEVL